MKRKDDNLYQDERNSTILIYQFKYQCAIQKFYISARLVNGNERLYSWLISNCNYFIWGLWEYSGHIFHLEGTAITEKQLILLSGFKLGNL